MTLAHITDDDVDLMNHEGLRDCLNCGSHFHKHDDTLENDEGYLCDSCQEIGMRFCDMCGTLGSSLLDDSVCVLCSMQPEKGV